VHIVGITLLAVVVLVILMFIVIYNGLIRLRNRYRNAWSQIDVQLKRRHDLVPNLVEAVKDYMSFEKETLENVTKARNLAAGAQGVKAQAAAETQLQGALSNFYLVMEKYPDLKANQNVSQLTEELTSTENKISFARQFYNDCIMRYNNKIEVIPSNVVALLCNFKESDFFETGEEEKAVPKVDLR